MGKNDGRDLLAISYALSSVLAEGKSADEINLIGAFFSVLGDSLALISARMELSEGASAANTSVAANTALTNSSAANAAANTAAEGMKPDKNKP